jgi:hypothetical protein
MRIIGRTSNFPFSSACILTTTFITMFFMFRISQYSLALMTTTFPFPIHLLPSYLL